MKEDQKAFEGWARTENPYDHVRLLKKKANGDYINTTSSIAWAVWQAAAKYYKQATDE